MHLKYLFQKSKVKTFIKKKKKLSLKVFLLYKLLVASETKEIGVY